MTNDEVLSTARAAAHLGIPLEFKEAETRVGVCIGGDFVGVIPKQQAMDLEDFAGRVGQTWFDVSVELPERCTQHRVYCGMLDWCQTIRRTMMEQRRLQPPLTARERRANRRVGLCIVAHTDNIIVDTGDDGRMRAYLQDRSGIRPLRRLLFDLDIGQHRVIMCLKQ